MTDGWTTALRDGSTWLPRSAADSFIARFSALTDDWYGEGLDDADFEAWRASQLANVLTKVTTRSPFYARHLAGTDLTAVSADDLTALPFTTKEDLRRELFDVLSGDVAEALFFYETTGTTGAATPCPRDRNEIVASNAHVTESWARIFRQHFGDRKPAIGLMGPTEIHSFGDTLGDVARNLGCMNAKIWPYSPVVGFERALELMRDLRLEVVVATPGVCLNLARAARLHGFDIRKDFAIKLFFLTGEMCTPALAADIDAVWGVRSYNILYGSQEAFVMGVASPSGAMRFTETNSIVELLDPESGASRGPRGEGELCVTSLVDGIKPLVRYRTGDLVRLTDDDDAFPGPRLEVIGRVRDQLVVGGRRVPAATVESAVLTGVHDALGYQVVIDVDEGGLDTIGVRLELLDPSAPHVLAQSAAIVARVGEILGVHCDVDIVEELDAIVSTGAFVSWKAARVVDLRSAPSNEERVAAALATRRGIAT